MIKEANLLKVELKFNMEEQVMNVESVYTKIFKEMIEDTNSEIELTETICKIEELIEDLIEKIDKNMSKESVANV
jgi:hypothetical protein